MTENTGKPLNMEADTLMDMNDPTQTIVFTLAEAMNAAQAIRNHVTETLDLYNPHGESVDNANLCSMALASIGREADDLRIRMGDALNEYIPARAQLEYCDDTDTLTGALILATRAAAMAQSIAEAQGTTDSGLMNAIYKAKSYCTEAHARLLCAKNQEGQEANA